MASKKTYNSERIKGAPGRPISVELPEEPPRLTPGAARALLRILLKAYDRLTEAESPQGGDAK
jgi:hypothetical protein